MPKYNNRSIINKRRSGWSHARCTAPFTLRLLVVIMCVLCCTTADVRAQDCIAALKKVYTKLNQLPAPGSASSYFMDYTLETVYRDAGRKKEVQRSEILLYRNKVRIRTPHLESYQDEKVGVVIDHRQHTVFLRTMPSFKAQEAQKAMVEQMQIVQETVLSDCEVLSCKTGKTAGVVQVELEVKKALRNVYPFRSVVFEVDTQALTIRSVRMNYKDDNAIDYIVVHYHSIDYNHPTPEDIGKPAVSFVMNDTALLERFAKYKLVDAREQ